jgi:hypothetical protein
MKQFVTGCKFSSATLCVGRILIHGQVKRGYTNKIKSFSFSVKIILNVQEMLNYSLCFMLLNHFHTL